jgi:type IV secretion system protein VirB3
MKKNVLFRGCTRPAMFMGVPYMPFFIGAGSGLLMSVYFNFFWLLSIPVVIFIMRQMARRDEMIFSLLGLRLMFKFKAKNLKHHSGLWVFSPNAYRKGSEK